MILLHRAKRPVAAMLAIVLICSLLPGLTAKAEDPPSYSAELNLEDQGIQVKLSADVKNQVFALQTQLGSGTQLGLFFSDEAFVLQDSLLLGGTYGIDLKNLAKNLPGSVFAPDSGSVLALDQPLYDAVLGSGREQEATVGIIGGADGPTAIFTGGSLTSSLLKSASTKVAPGTLTVGTQTIKTTETTVSLDARGMAKLAGQLLAEIQDDEAAKASLAQIFDNLAKLGALELNGSDGQQMAARLLEDLDKTTADLEESLTQAGAAVTAAYSMDKETKKPVSAFASLSCNGKTYSINTIFTGGIYSLVLDTGDGQPLTVALNIEEDTDSAFALRFYMTRGDAPNSQITFRWDKIAETYVFTAENGDEVDELTGTVQVTDDTIVITADTANGQALRENSLTLRRSDPVTLPEFQDMITMSEDGILEVLQSAIITAQNLLGLAA